MRRFGLFSICLLFMVKGQTQYKNDNVLFKTIDPSEVCKYLAENPAHLLLDVRTVGEYNDTSRFAGLNFGHLDGALNIPVAELGQKLSTIAGFKNQPVFVYCSHSQRSRRALKQLADSGFTKLYNINGGITAVYYENLYQEECLRDMLKSNLNYHFISPQELCKRLDDPAADTYILDVRSDSAWQGISLNPQENAFGRIRGAHHISLPALRKDPAQVPEGQDIIITDLDGTEAAYAATLLAKRGKQSVFVLVEGIDRWLAMSPEDLPCKYNKYESNLPIQIISAPEAFKFISKDPTMHILDIRSAAEFSGTHKDAFRNIGRVEHAVNIPLDSLSHSLSAIEGWKVEVVLLYGFGGGIEPFKAASMLVADGFKEVYVLQDGIFGLRWTAHNIAGQSGLAGLVTAVPEINQ